MGKFFNGEMLRTRKEIAEMYQCHPDTLKKYLKDAGIPNRSRITPGDFEALQRIMGTPTKLKPAGIQADPFTFQ